MVALGARWWGRCSTTAQGDVEAAEGDEHRIISRQEHILVSFFLIRLSVAHHHDWAVGVPDHRVRHAAHKSALEPPETPASQHYQACTHILPYGDYLLVWSAHPEVRSRNGSTGLLHSPCLLFEQPLAHLANLLTWLLGIEAQSLVVRSVLRVQDESHV